MSVGDLINLAVVETDEAHSLLTSVYNWKYEHITSSAKALAGAGSAIALATLVPVIQSGSSSPVDYGWVLASWITAGILVASGLMAFGLARRVHSEFVSAQTLLAEMIEIRAFIKRFKSDEDQS